MSDLYWLMDEQMARLEPYFPKSHGRPCVDVRRVLSGIIFVNRNGLRWCDAPKAYGPHKTLYNRWKRWGEMGVFLRMMEGLAAAGAEPRTVMIDATNLKAHRTASSLRVKKGSRPADRPHQGHEHQAARRHRCQRSDSQLLNDRRPGQRLYRRYSPARRSAQGAVDAGRPWIRCRLVQGCPSGKGHNALHPGPNIASRTDQIRQAPLQKPQPHRDHVRTAQKLVPRRHPLRKMSHGLLLRHNPRRNCRLLAVINES